MSQRPWDPGDVRIDKPSAARMYDYFLGGYHNFAVDRQAAEQLIKIYPEFPQIMRAGRGFLRRVVQFLVANGIDQFLDIGSGVPTVGNVHEIAQQVNPAARVVYVDIDPIAVRHSVAILQGNPNVVVIQANAQQPELILNNPEVRGLLDFGKPMAVLLAFFLHFVTDDAAATDLVRVFRTAVVPGSYLVISHGSPDDFDHELNDQGPALYARSTDPLRLRTQTEIAAFFDGLNLVEPGLVKVPLWRPEGPDDLFLDSPERAGSYGGVGRKP